MIVAETADGYRFVSQPDHAALAGQFADHWGNETFDRPEPFSSVALASYRHDDGWWRYDRRPHLHDDGTPVDFTELSAETWNDLYAEGIGSVVDLDPYAGLLVSMHGSGLRRRRYGLSPSWSSTPAAFADFVAEQEELQRKLARELREAGRISEADDSLLSALHETGEPPDDVDSQLWWNYALLQAWDTLSLSFCTTVAPPGYGKIGSVPTGASGPDETLTVEPIGDGTFRIEPYPFDVDPLFVTVPARRVRTDAFDDESSLLRAYYAAGREVEEFQLQYRDF